MSSLSLDLCGHYPFYWHGISGLECIFHAAVKADCAWHVVESIACLATAPAYRHMDVISSKDELTPRMGRLWMRIDETASPPENFEASLLHMV